MSFSAQKNKRQKKAGLPNWEGRCDMVELHDQAKRNRKNQSRRKRLSTIGRYNVFMSDGQKSLLYARVETVLANEISDGELKVGDQLPTEDSLVARFGVSRITVRRAIQNLVGRGLVEIRRGKGTFEIGRASCRERV